MSWETYSDVETAVRFYRGPRYESHYWKTPMAASTVWGLASYKRRDMYIDDPEDGKYTCADPEAGGGAGRRPGPAGKA